MQPRLLPLAALAAATALALTGCVPNASAPGATHAALTVDSSATACTVSGSTASAGNVTFTVSNSGDQVTEFYLLGDDQLRIVGEAENIGPGLSRTLVVDLSAGSYFTACKPGMTGTGIGQAPFTVTPSSAADAATNAPGEADLAARIDTANTNYASYVKDQIGQLVTGTAAFAAAYTAGDDNTARGLYAATRAHWERVETVAESFGDLDPKLDLREADLEEGQDWTGWHAIEKDLWPADAEAGFAAYPAAERARLAGLLVADTATLNEKVQPLTFTLAQQTNGAIGLLDEVASGKVTGEEEVWSHTDLWDFQANVDGARVLYAGVRDVLVQKDAALAETLDTRFAALQTLLDAQRVGDGFVLYTDLSTGTVKGLADQVNALAEPLGRLTAALVL
ncbi:MULTISPECIES: iron uptake system protein EfeO [unclassified Cryobacterium]|uniref:iron uptake system protein EfeO n=1 Tax=unclassified Cryobacterium TaxID=2649013 RepID=UPI002AB3FED5|nr:MULTISPECIES: iron uptake system protein EfeO [unclassified Cryobacterium]MDY7543164.1 iron uptake system protein EfeO [Cryobacterium sp. 5B3]MEA9998849.1 imelysin family protein [Cryobacterium sp. RTS3]MEB0266706.1 imelysin family protein [Cryobacterium sp. 10I5]MEB0275547.1 imelysin family protein [Cryobacterium sp. 5B3]